MRTYVDGHKDRLIDIMTATLVTVGMHDTVASVEAVLDKKGLTLVPVIDSERNDCFGVISLKDISHFHAAKKNSKAVEAWEICSYKPLMASTESSIEEVARLMVDHSIHHVVVMEKGQLKGIVSSLDIVAACLPPTAMK